MQLDYSFAKERVREWKAKLFLGLIFGLIAVTVHAQGVSVSGTAVVNTTTSVSGIPGNSVLQAVPNAQITVCSSAGGGIPCTPLVTIYSNVALTVVAANPLTADANGNFQFFVAPNATGYIYSQTGSGIVGQLFTIAPQSTSVTSLNATNLIGPGTVTGAYTAPSINKVITLDGVTYPASGSAQNTTGGCTSGQSTLTLAAALDFKNGQGIAVPGCGPVVSIAAASACSVTQVGAAGAATYQYQMVLYDFAGGRTAPNTATVTNTGNATLGLVNYNNFTCTVPNGAFAAAVYGRVSGTMNYLGMAWCSTGSSCTFFDTGSVHAAANGPSPIIPATVPAAAANQFLLTTISSGGGTTTLTLAANAGATIASGALVYHDDTTAICSALNAIPVATGGTLVFPQGTYYVHGPECNSPPANRDIFYLNTNTHLHITGAGSASVMTTLFPQPPNFFEFHSGFENEIDHMAFNLPAGGHMDAGTNTAGYVITATSQNNLRIHDDEFIGGASPVVHVSASVAYSYVEKNYIHGGSDGGINEDSCGFTATYSGCDTQTTPFGNTFIHNKLSAFGETGLPTTNGSQGSQGISTDAGNFLIYSVIAFNYLEGCAGCGNNPYNANYSGIKVGNSQFVAVEGNTLNQIDATGISVTPPNGATVHHVVVDGNVISNPQQSCISFGVGGTGIMTGFDVSGNTCWAPGTWGITTNTPASADFTDSVIDSNVVQNAGQGGANTYDSILLLGQHLTLAGNTLSGFSGQTRSGINITAGSTNISVAKSGQTIYGMGTSPIIGLNGNTSDDAASVTGAGACSTNTGSPSVGTFTCTAATAASTITLTFNNAHTGWTCNVYDQTTRTNIPQQTSNNGTSCTLTVTSVTQNDVMVWSASWF